MRMERNVSEQEEAAAPDAAERKKDCSSRFVEEKRGDADIGLHPDAHLNFP